MKSAAAFRKMKLPAASLTKDKGGDDLSPRLQGFDSNPQRNFGPPLWRAFRDSLAHLYTLSLPDPLEEERFSLSSRTYATPRAIVMHCKGTAFHHDAGACSGRARRRPAAHPASDRGLG
ncbi:MAG: hypothetical protein WDN50_14310 [Bradyrhizobium sp.]